MRRCGLKQSEMVAAVAGAGVAAAAPVSTVTTLVSGDCPGDVVCGCNVTVITCSPGCPARHMGALFSTVDEVQLAAVKTVGGRSCTSVCSINANAWWRQVLSPVKALRTTPTVPGMACHEHHVTGRAAEPGLYLTAESCGWRMEKVICGWGLR